MDFATFWQWLAKRPFSDEAIFSNAFAINADINVPVRFRISLPSRVAGSCVRFAGALNRAEFLMIVPCEERNTAHLANCWEMSGRTAHNAVAFLICVLRAMASCGAKKGTTNSTKFVAAWRVATKAAS